MEEGTETTEGIIDGKEYRYPHCDSMVLHAPSACQYCDAYPLRQAQRLVDGVNFTGQHDPHKEPCPAEQCRPVETINAWCGNVPRPDPNINPTTGYPRAAAPPRLKKEPQA